MTRSTWTILLVSSALALAPVAAGCGDSGDPQPGGDSRVGGGAADGGAGGDTIATLGDGPSGKLRDGGGSDDGVGGARDGSGGASDGASDGGGSGAPDTGAPKPDTTAPKPDAAAPKPDSGPPNTTGLSKPCSKGPGWTVFRFHYSSSSTSARIDVWDASCSYSFAPNSACNVREVYPGFGTVSRTSQGYPILTSREYLRVRFSVAGLRFKKAAVYVQARSYATSSSTYFRVWSPLYGGLRTGPVDNDWVYDWYGLDWTGYLTPTDKPSLTAIQIYADSGSGKLAVKAVELCVQ